MSGQASDSRRDWVMRVLGVAVPAVQAETGARPDVGELATRLRKLLDRVKDAGSPPDMLDDLRAAGAALKGNDPGLAGGLLDEVEGRLASRARAAEAAAEIARAAPSKKGAVAFAQVRLRWAAARAAREEALNDLETVCAAMLALPEAEDDPQYEETRAAAEQVVDRMPLPASGIDDAIDAMASIDETRREAARKQALDAIKTYRADLDAEPALKLLQDMPVGKFAIYDRVAKALDELAAALSA